MGRVSLRWRLPFCFGAFVTITLATFLWVASATVTGTVVGAGRARAQAGADQVADMLASAFAAHLAQGARYSTNPALLAVLNDPSPANAAAARAALVTSTEPDVRRAEIWDDAGTLVLEITTQGVDSTAEFQAYPPGPPPTGGGFGQLRAVGNANFYDIVTELRDDSSPDSRVLGYLRRFGRLRSTSGGSVRRLIGDDTVLKIGAPEGGAWTDFFTTVDAPPPPDPGGREGEYRAADGTRWVGASAAIEPTPWRVWILFPRQPVIAPAQSFVRRMAALSLLLVLAGVAAAGVLGVRLAQPLHALARAAGDIAAGNYARRVSTQRRDEIGSMSTAFNRMADAIQQAHSALQVSHEQTHFALAAARIGVWESELATGRMICSESMHLVLGCARDALPATITAFLEWVHPDDRAAVQRVLEGRDTSDVVIELAYRTVDSHGAERWIEGRGRIRFDDHGRPVSVLGVGANMTDRRHLEAQLLQSQKMEVVGQLAGGVAHDFNNLLTAIMGHAELLLLRLNHAELREDVQEILNAGQSAAMLTRQLLAFSRRQVLKTDVIDVNDVIKRTEKLLGRLLGESIIVRMDLAPPPARVKVDVGRLEQVLMNLAVNARDAMPDGGTLTITSAIVELSEEGRDGQYPVSPGRYVSIAVSDTGAGMDLATRARLFEPFFTTKPVGKGTGLGLATVYGIVKQSGGHIGVRTQLGCGSTFEIYLPATEEAATPRCAETPARGLPPTRATVLIVDDNDAVRAVASTILKRTGYRVLAVASGEEALRTLESADAPPDLVVSDVIMPGITGPELARRLARRHANVKVLFTSGYSGDVIDRHGLEVGSALFIEKPYTAGALAAKVREALAS